MERILRGVLRFSSGGLTYFRIDWKLCVSAPSETSAHTGRLTSLRGLFCVPAMCLPKKIVYAIQTASADSHIGCSVKDNPCSYVQVEHQSWPKLRSKSRMRQAKVKLAATST